MCKPTYMTTYGPTIFAVVVAGAILLAALLSGG